MDQPKDYPKPPGIPASQPRFRPRPMQLCGMAVLAVMPVLALMGVFGENFADTRAADASLELNVRYPQRMRYKTIDPLDVRVRNLSDQVLKRVVVSVERGYLSQFSNVTITPSPDKAYEVELSDLQPGEERLVSLEIQGEAYGHHRGQIAAAGGASKVAVRVATFTFP